LIFGLIWFSFLSEDCLLGRLHGITIYPTYLACYLSSPNVLTDAQPSSIISNRHMWFPLLFILLCMAVISNSCYLNLPAVLACTLQSFSALYHLVIPPMVLGKVPAIHPSAQPSPLAAAITCAHHTQKDPTCTAQPFQPSPAISCPA